ncbi:pitrilysin family protein [Catenulispora subtropica]|uniref:Pitrilysin family protein n=1 Tax=Catenulispora subtropica TaxID=450798 RepID=A0ABN2TA38_9ACTN
MLGNGLRVVFSPDRAAPVAGVAVAYDVGTRSESPGRAGFAHLFEHLMFQGSVGLRRSAHARCVERSGGSFSGSTHLDHTMYSEVAPANALERLLYLESDRMRGLRLTEASLANQISVVKEEIRTNVLSRPYAGFPWPRLAPVMFGSFANTHDGHGSFADLEAASLADAAEFFDRHYTSRNAVLSVCGDFDPDRVARHVERFFEDVPDRAAPARVDLGEPEPEGGRACYRDPVAPLPAVAWGWRVPDPVGALADFLPHVLLAGLLAAADGGRLVRRLVVADRSATSVTARAGLLGDAFTLRDPSALVFQARMPAAGTADRVLAGAFQEMDVLARRGPEAGELAGVVAQAVAGLLGKTDSVLGRARRLAVFELQRAAPELLGELPALLAAVGPDRVRGAAAQLTPDRCVSIELIPAAGA